ncbi:MAG: hypothetical protein FJ144_09410 [Deltaproteobacteria bacterium]|nr:hypothetical protein [Deltaproteobacteria bacterium]
MGHELLIAAMWVWGLASLPEQTPVPLANLGRALFWLMIFAHGVEVFAYYDVIREAPGSTASNVARTFLWGSIHLREIGAIS